MWCGTYFVVAHVSAKTMFVPPRRVQALQVDLSRLFDGDARVSSMTVSRGAKYVVLWALLLSGDTKLSAYPSFDHLCDSVTTWTAFLQLNIDISDASSGRGPSVSVYSCLCSSHFDFSLFIGMWVGSLFSVAQWASFASGAILFIFVLPGVGELVLTGVTYHPGRGFFLG